MASMKIDHLLPQPEVQQLFNPFDQQPKQAM